jgi:phosphomannomutase
VRKIWKIPGVKRSKGKGGMDNMLKFGTSGLRDTVENMTDRECYINTRGFIDFLKETGEIEERGSCVAIGGDLRVSTPRIMASVARAIEDLGFRVISCGSLPSPALAYYAIKKKIPSIMVTGSHIPEDRNGIKFTKCSGEVLKSDEKIILKNVANARIEVTRTPGLDGLFDANGMFLEKPAQTENAAGKEAIDLYVSRYTRFFPEDGLSGVKVVLYQHSAVGRDIVKRILEELGAEVVTVGRSEKFIPVDTEKISKQTLGLLGGWAKEHKPFVIISTDGDSDRPLLADESGSFIPGDKLGALVCLYLNPDFAAIPVSANDAVIKALSSTGVKVKQTKIGSPYVVKAMADEKAMSPSSKVVSWESNGGFLLGSDWHMGENVLDALPTRDAVLPIIAVIMLAKRQKSSISGIVGNNLPSRYTDAGVVDNSTPGCEKYTAEMGKNIVKDLTPAAGGVVQADFEKGQVTVEGKSPAEPLRNKLEDIKQNIEVYFNEARGFGKIKSINFVDGIKVVFGGGDVVHLRPSGNAPEFRVYATADSRERAGEIVSLKDEVIPAIIRGTAAVKFRSVGAMASTEGRVDPAVIDHIKAGRPFLIEPYVEKKVWGVGGVGEFWYGPGEEGKSSIAVISGQKLRMDGLLSALPDDILGGKALKKFGIMAPLVKILTPKGRLSVQFHDSKNELWIVTACDSSLSQGKNWIILGFSRESVEKYGKAVTTGYAEALREYGEKLNALIDAVEAEGEIGKDLLFTKKDVLAAAKQLEHSVPAIAGGLESFLKARSAVEYFYSYRYIQPGDVIPVPSGTLHALGPGVCVIEPQISGPTQSLEDGATYPVRYYFPGYQKEGALKKLDIDRAGEMKPEVTVDALPEVLESGKGYTVERLPGNFSKMGLEARRITFERPFVIKDYDDSGMHSIVAVSGEAFVCYDGIEYPIPEAVPGKAMMIVPASCRGYAIKGTAHTALIDTFTPV